MVLLEIFQSDLTLLDTLPWCVVTAAPVPCEHCRLPLTFCFIRMGSITERLSWAHLPIFLRRLLRLPDRIVLRLYALHIATLATDQHLRLTQRCPICGDDFELDIFLTIAKIGDGTTPSASDSAK